MKQNKKMLSYMKSLVLSGFAPRTNCRPMDAAGAFARTGHDKPW